MHVRKLAHNVGTMEDVEWENNLKLPVPQQLLGLKDYRHKYVGSTTPNMGDYIEY